MQAVNCRNDKMMVKAGLRVPEIKPKQRVVKKKLSLLTKEQLENLKKFNITAKTEKEALKLLRRKFNGLELTERIAAKAKRINGDINTPYDKNSGNQLRKKSSQITNIRNSKANLKNSISNHK